MGDEEGVDFESRFFAKAGSRRLAQSGANYSTDSCLRITITNSVLVQLTLVLKADIFCWWTQSLARLLTPVLEEQGLVLTCRMGVDPMELLVRTILTVSVAL